MNTANWMLRLCLPVIIAQGAVCLPAQAFNLNGAWATESDICPKIFAKTTKAVTFKENSEEYGKGLIVDGNRVEGQRLKCVIKSRKEKGPETRVVASCATEIMIDQVRLTFKTVDDNTIVRMFSGAGGVESTYIRCQL